MSSATDTDTTGSTGSTQAATAAASAAATAWAAWDRNDEISIFREYLRIASVQPNVDYGTHDGLSPSNLHSNINTDRL